MQEEHLSHVKINEQKNTYGAECIKIMWYAYSYKVAKNASLLYNAWSYDYCEDYTGQQ